MTLTLGERLLDIRHLDVSVAVSAIVFVENQTCHNFLLDESVDQAFVTFDFREDSTLFRSE
jgi:hypothetical protein